MEELNYKMLTGDKVKNLLSRADELATKLWPEFMLHDEIGNRHWEDLYETFDQYQFALEDEDTGELFATANSIPLRYDGDLYDLPNQGWDWAIQKGVKDALDGTVPNLLCAIQIAIAKDYQDVGLSPLIIDLMKELTDDDKLLALIAPVRPIFKSKYPLTSIDDYIEWMNNDEQFDPWLRVHERAGASMIGPCHEAMTISGTIKEWESWTNTKFPKSGKYIIPGALVPIEMDLEKDRGTYIEPNVWMAHPIR